MTTYFMVGTIHGGWHGHGAREMLDDWIEAGEWVLGWHDMESDPDKHRASSHGRYTSSVAGLHVDYLKPQENGSHHGCDYVVLSDGERSIAAVAETALSFNASPYTQEELAAKAHNVDLVPAGETVWCLDYAQNGIGSNSCGPQVLEKYKLDAEEFRFAFTLVPATGVQ